MNFQSDFSSSLIWGVSSSAFQTEGFSAIHGKGKSIWDEFLLKKKIANKDQSNYKATEFYIRFEEDLDLIKTLGVKHYRFSISWSRILPEGYGKVNSKGIDFYNQLIDACLQRGIQPWVTLYHWDLPQNIQLKGGWVNRDILGYFKDYVAICMRHFGDRVKHWMILNEPASFVGLGYFLGIHAPGLKGLNNFLPAAHHACLAISENARFIKSIDPSFQVGSTFSFSPIEPHDLKLRNVKAANRVDALLNRFFLEPLLGLGYPVECLPGLSRIEQYFKPDDEGNLLVDLDFIGVQNYSREVVAQSYFTPYVKARLIQARKRKKRTTAMNWEFYPEALALVLERLSEYDNMPSLLVTETGIATEDKINKSGSIADKDRIEFYQRSFKAIHENRKAKEKLMGIFLWSLTDNIEWAEGTRPRFGLTHIDYKNQKRIPKDSFYWFRDFLK